MPQNQRFRPNNYNPLGATDASEMDVQTDAQGYHEIKVYNGVRDKLWELLGNAVLSDKLFEVLTYAEQMQIMMLRAESVWRGVAEGASAKAKGLGLDKTKNFEYNGEMKTCASELKKYINFYKNPSMFIDPYGNPDNEYYAYLALDNTSKLQFFKDVLERIVTELDSSWSQLASRIGMGIPLKIAEENELFFRRYKRTPNRIHPRGTQTV